MNRKIVLIGGVCSALVLGSGCSSAPGTPGQQGAVVGGASGAAVGAAVTKNHALGAIIGGAVGAAGGYVIGGKTGHLDKNKAEENAQNNPATTQQATSAQTADVNGDGFVTLDELVALNNAGLTDDEMIQRIAATGLTFDLNSEQIKYLTDHGIRARVIQTLPQINRGGVPVPTVAPGSSVISR